MYKNILIPVALDHGSDVSAMIQVARRLLSEDGKITLLSVVEEVPSYVVEYVSVKPEGKILDEVNTRLKAMTNDHSDLACAVVAGNPGVAIAKYAEEKEADLIVVQSHRPGLQEYFLGSTASRIARRASCAVFVLR